MNLFIGLAILGAVLSGLSIPLALGKVSRNAFYGIRTPRTMHGPMSEWYATNKKGGLALSVVGGILFLVGAVGALMGSHSYVGVILAIALLESVLLITIVKHWK